MPTEDQLVDALAEAGAHAVHNATRMLGGSKRHAVAALAMALGTLCEQEKVDLNDVLGMVRTAHEAMSAQALSA